MSTPLYRPRPFCQLPGCTDRSYEHLHTAGHMCPTPMCRDDSETHMIAFVHLCSNSRCPYLNDSQHCYFYFHPYAENHELMYSGQYSAPIPVRHQTPQPISPPSQQPISQSFQSQPQQPQQPQQRSFGTVVTEPLPLSSPSFHVSNSPMALTEPPSIGVQARQRDDMDSQRLVQSEEQQIQADRILTKEPGFRVAEERSLCPSNLKCQDNSPDHREAYSHSCRYGTNCRFLARRDRMHLGRYRHFMYPEHAWAHILSAGPEAFLSDPTGKRPSTLEGSFISDPTGKKVAVNYTVDMMGLRVTVKEGDILTEKVDAIVHFVTDERNLIPKSAQGFTGHLARAGGPELLKECADQVAMVKRLNVGAVIPTRAFGRLQCKYVLHVLAPRTVSDLRVALTAVLQCSAAYSLKTIAVAFAFSGLLRESMEECAKVAVESVSAQVKSFGRGGVNELRFINLADTLSNAPNDALFTSLRLHDLNAQKSYQLQQEQGKNPYYPMPSPQQL